eukprot:6210807-Pleurochrysis_carterae.AAC.1
MWKWAHMHATHVGPRTGTRVLTLGTRVLNTNEVLTSRRDFKSESQKERRMCDFGLSGTIGQTDLERAIYALSADAAECVDHRDVERVREDDGGDASGAARRKAALLLLQPERLQLRAVLFIAGERDAHVGHYACDGSRVPL